MPVQTRNENHTNHCRRQKPMYISYIKRQRWHQNKDKQLKIKDRTNTAIIRRLFSDMGKHTYNIQHP